MAKAFGTSMSKVTIGMEIASNETIKQAVMAGMGIAFLSAHAVALELRLRRLVMLDIRAFPKMENWYIVHRREKRLPAVATAFKDFLRTDGAAITESVPGIGRINRYCASPRRGR